MKTLKFGISVLFAVSIFSCNSSENNSPLDKLAIQVKAQVQYMSYNIRIRKSYS